MTRGADPAFPAEVVKHPAGAVGNAVPIMERSPGMTKREEFAKAAMQGYLANPMLHDKRVLEAIVAGAGRTSMSPPEIVAMLAREQADALLAELDRNP